MNKLKNFFAFFCDDIDNEPFTSDPISATETTHLININYH